MKVLKVKLHHIDRGQCMEVWSVKPKKGGPRRYVARNTSGNHEWSWLCDAPYGYCERDFECSPGIMFIICDKYGHAILRDGNDRTKFPNSFPTLEECCDTAWKDIEKNQYITRIGFGEWILKQATVPLRTGADEQNWKDCFQEIDKVEVLSRFKFLKRRKAIYKLTKRHTECGATWYEYYVGNFPYNENECFDKFFAYEFHEKHIGEILELLGKRCDDIDHASVHTAYDEERGLTSHSFMGKSVGYNLSYEEICDIKNRAIKSVADSYQEATTYFYALRNNEGSIRDIDAILYFIRKQIQEAKILRMKQ